MSEETIFPDDDRAARKVTVTGWVSRDGRFYGDDERIARYAGSTHTRCQYCEAPTVKHYTACDSCRAKKAIERYEALPKKEWDGVGMLYSDAADEYFNDLSDAEDSLNEGETLADLRLLICEPNYIRELCSEYCCDELPEDGDLPPAVEEAMAAFNKAVAGIVLSWSPSKFAILLPKDTTNDQ